MNYVIRTMKKSEYSLLDDFIYEAIYIPEGVVHQQNQSLIIPTYKFILRDLVWKKMTIV